jgi:hypothetical protein
MHGGTGDQRRGATNDHRHSSDKCTNEHPTAGHFRWVHSFAHRASAWGRRQPQRDLVDNGPLPSSAFDEAYAVARLTPGTNLLAMYTLLGERFAGWKGALSALAVGTLVPATVAVGLGAGYVAYVEHPLASRAMQGARAGDSSSRSKNQSMVTDLHNALRRRADTSFGRRPSGVLARHRVL